MALQNSWFKIQSCLLFQFIKTRYKDWKHLPKTYQSYDYHNKPQAGQKTYRIKCKGKMIGVWHR